MLARTAGKGLEATDGGWECLRGRTSATSDKCTPCLLYSTPWIAQRCRYGRHRVAAAPEMREHGVFGHAEGAVRKHNAKMKGVVV